MASALCEPRVDLAGATAPRPGTGRAGAATTSALLFLGLFAAYTANGRAIGAGDTVPATLLPLAILRGDGPFLDRFEPALRAPDGRLPGYVTRSRGRVVSRYPVTPALLALPLVWPQVAARDWASPGWDRDPVAARRECVWMGKVAASALAALGAVALLHLLRGLGLGRPALGATLVASLGSDTWAVAAQAPWQHGSAALCLTVALLLLLAPSRRRLAAAGLMSALAVACRPLDLVFAAALGLWAARRRARPERLAFFLPALAVAAALGTYNVAFFGTLSGGYAQIERLHPSMHGTKGPWAGSLIGGSAGTLLSPSHGLLVYCPWVALAVAALPASTGRLPRGSPARALLWALLPNFLLLSKYSCWWGGHCFGPRYWIDATPALAVALALALDRPAAPRAWRAAVAGAFAWSVALQLVGASCFPSTWHSWPNNPDRHHERLWGWRDCEVTRGLAEGMHPPAW